MPTKEELVKLYSTFSDKNLLDIINKNDQYTTDAIGAAMDEINKRDIKKDQVQDYIEKQIVEAEISNHIAKIELTFFEKMRSFFLWLLPFFEFAKRMNMLEDGLYTKIRQSKLFSIIGFITFMLTGILAVIFNHSNFESISIWVLFFAITFIIEKKVKYH